jgi:predicted MPP superfamily phosphohydrolase
MPPLPFIATVLAIMGALHYYIGARILPDLPIGDGLRMVGWGLLVLSWLLIPMGLLARFIRRESLADKAAWLGLLTMGFSSSLMVLTFARDVSLIAMGAFSYYSPVWQMRSAEAVPIVAFLVSALGFLNARRLASVVDVDVRIDGLPAALEGFTIAQISDIHVGPTIKRAYLDRIVDRVNGLNADIVAVTGDLVDGSVRDLAPHTAPLARLKGRYGSYFVTGNHEYYSNAHDWIAEISRLGLHVLMNEHVIIEQGNAKVVLAGVPDYTAHQFDESHRSDPASALAGAPADAAVRILLAHQPRTANAAAAAGFDLQLSGHTHGGQFFPWNLLVPLQQPYTAGLNLLGKLWVYTSRGTGYWGPPKRFGAPSEITRLRLMRA